MSVTVENADCPNCGVVTAVVCTLLDGRPSKGYCEKCGTIIGWDERHLMYLSRFMPRGMKADEVPVAEITITSVEPPPGAITSGRET